MDLKTEAAFEQQKPKLVEAEKLLSVIKNVPSKITSKQTRTHSPSPSKFLIAILVFLAVGAVVTFLIIFNKLIHYEKNGSEVGASILNSIVEVTEDQQSVLNQLKSRLRGNLTKDFMKENSFLVNWLKVNQWDLENTEEALLDAKWRKEWRLDEIIQEDFKHFEKDFPSYADGVDKEGRPVHSMDWGAWDIRKAVVTGKSKPLLRYIFRKMENFAKRLRDAQSHGENVTQVILINNLHGFGGITHLCSICISFLNKWITYGEENYPQMLYKVIFFNVPEGMEFVISLTTSSSMETSVELYGTDKTKWQPAILKYIDSEQIRQQFGGTKVDTEFDD